jgi:hypothetical protein
MSTEDIKNFEERRKERPDVPSEDLLRDEIDELRSYIDFIWKVMT